MTKEIRNPKSEIRNPKPIVESGAPGRVRNLVFGFFAGFVSHPFAREGLRRAPSEATTPSGFVIHLSFVIRHSSFGGVPRFVGVLQNALPPFA